MMLSSSEPRVTRPLTDGKDTPVDSFPPFSQISPIPTSPPFSQISPIPTSWTSTKLPLLIPASTKRPRTQPLSSPTQLRRAFILPTVLIAGTVMFLIASLFVIPLDNSQHPRTVAQTISDLITSGHFSSVNTLQQVAKPTLTPAILTGEGYCGGTDIWGVCATLVTESGVIGTGQMQRPIQGAVITQPFGHNEYQLWCGCWKPHSGIDLAAPYGSPIMAADSGQVIWTGWDWSGLGWAVKINHGNYIATIYGHLERFIVRVGQNVTQGQVIGYEGSTGASTGPHLHFMVLYNNVWVNPINYVQLP